MNTDPEQGAPSAGFAGATERGEARQGGGALLRGAGPLPYSDVIRRRWRQPRFRGELAGASHVAEDVNPLCGDRVRMMLKVEDGRVAAARFIGDSCAICTASADVVSELAVGRAAATPPHAADVLEILQTDVRPTRMRCVTLPITVLQSALGDGHAPR
jgi:nitrogen fixation protein NifU and related proteins